MKLQWIREIGWCLTVDSSSGVFDGREGLHLADKYTLKSTYSNSIGRQKVWYLDLHADHSPGTAVDHISVDGYADDALATVNKWLKLNGYGEPGEDLIYRKRPAPTPPLT